MKIIYMAVTLNLMAQVNPEEVGELLQNVEVKSLESGEKYIVLYED